MQVKRKCYAPGRNNKLHMLGSFRSFVATMKITNKDKLDAFVSILTDAIGAVDRFCWRFNGYKILRHPRSIR